MTQLREAGAFTRDWLNFYNLLQRQEIELARRALGV